MSTKTYLKIAAAHLCEPLNAASWYDLTTSQKARLTNPLLFADECPGYDGVQPLQPQARSVAADSGVAQRGG